MGTSSNPSIITRLKRRLDLSRRRHAYLFLSFVLDLCLHLQKTSCQKLLQRGHHWNIKTADRALTSKRCTMSLSDTSSNNGETPRKTISWADLAAKPDLNWFRPKFTRRGTRDKFDGESFDSLFEQQTLGTRFDQRPLEEDLLLSIKTARRHREVIVGKRVAVLDQRENYRYQREAVKKSHIKLFHAVASFKTFLAEQGMNIASIPEVQLVDEAFREMEPLGEGLINVETRLRQAENDLSSRESRLATDETHIYQSLSYLVGSSPSHSTVHPPELRSRSSSSNTSTVLTEPLARQYYDMAGTVKNLRERLHNMQVQHLQEVSARQNDLESGRILHPPEKEFQKRYYITLTSLYGELHTAKKKSLALKELCGETEVVLEDTDESFNNTEALHLPLELDRQLIHKAATQENSEDQSAFLSDFLSGYMDSKLKVSDWLNRLESSVGIGGVRSVVSQQGEFWKTEVDAGIAKSRPSISTIPHISSDDRLSVMAALSSARMGKDDGPHGVSVKSSLKSWPTSLLSHDFIGEAPSRRYSDSVLDRPSLIVLEDLENTWEDQNHPNSTIS